MKSVEEQLANIRKLLIKQRVEWAKTIAMAARFGDERTQLSEEELRAIFSELGIVQRSSTRSDDR